MNRDGAGPQPQAADSSPGSAVASAQQAGNTLVVEDLQTFFFTKGRIAPEDFERRVVGLVERVVLDKPERKEASDQ